MASASQKRITFWDDNFSYLTQIADLFQIPEKGTGRESRETLAANLLIGYCRSKGIHNQVSICGGAVALGQETTGNRPPSTELPQKVSKPQSALAELGDLNFDDL